MTNDITWHTLQYKVKVCLSCHLQRYLALNTPGPVKPTDLVGIKRKHAEIQEQSSKKIKGIF